MILLTGASGLIGMSLLPRLLEANRRVRCLIREPRGLGPLRVRVQLALGDITRVRSFDNALRGVDTVIHLAGTIRDQPSATIEEVNALATLRLARAARDRGVGRFVHFSALGASPISASRVMRSKAAGESALENVDGMARFVASPSLVYGTDDTFLRHIEWLSRLPAVPVPGNGRALFRPIFADDVTEAVMRMLEPEAEPGRYALVGPHEMSLDSVIRAALSHLGRRRALMHVPSFVVRPILSGVERWAGPTRLPTWDEVQMLETSATGSPDDIERRLGIQPRALTSILSAAQ